MAAIAGMDGRTDAVYPLRHGRNGPNLIMRHNALTNHSGPCQLAGSCCRQLMTSCSNIDCIGHVRAKRAVLLMSMVTREYAFCGNRAVTAALRLARAQGQVPAASSALISRRAV